MMLGIKIKKFHTQSRIWNRSHKKKRAWHDLAVHNRTSSVMIPKGRWNDRKILRAVVNSDRRVSLSNPEISLDKRYIGTEYKNYICSICMDVCQKPRQCKDGHLFCFSWYVSITIQFYQLLSV
jgi:hypothetical protein